MLWESMVAFFKSWFSYPGLEWYLILVSIGLAIVFAVIWLLGHKPPLIKKPGLWVVAIVSAFLTMLAITFVQIPLRYYYGQAIDSNLSQDTIANLLLLVGIPMVLISGLVQEGAKMIPMVFWWWRSGKKLDPKMGLIIGALAGAGFGVFEAVWLHNQLFMSGWTWEAVNYGAVQALLPFWERFWTIALHIAVSALAGYGLAKGKGWQFFLLASILNTMVNYIVFPYSKGMLTSNQAEIIMAAVAALVMLAALWLRWRKDKEEPQIVPVEPIEPVEPAGPAEIEI
jgi:RsiW-degrading membrane proteinase PrsW (M82 family)